MTARQMTLWSAILAFAAIVGSYGLACVLPFAALAAIAAFTLDKWRGAATVGGAWLANQIVGFTLLSYPIEGQAFAWSAILFLSTIAAFFAARTLIQVAASGAIGVLATAIVVYQIGMFIGAVVLDGFASSTPEIVATVMANDVIWFAGLMAIWFVLRRTSLGRASRATA